MENSDLNQIANTVELKRAKYWILTLALGVVICLSLIIYTLITHNPAIDFLDSSFYKSGLDWLGFIGFFLLAISYLLLWISTSILKKFPKNKRWISITAISGIFLLILGSILLFISFDIEHHLANYISLVFLMAGSICITFIKELIEHKFNKIAKRSNLLVGFSCLLIGVIFSVY